MCWRKSEGKREFLGMGPEHEELFFSVGVTVRDAQWCCGIFFGEKKIKPNQNKEIENQQKQTSKKPCLDTILSYVL